MLDVGANWSRRGHLVPCRVHPRRGSRGAVRAGADALFPEPASARGLGGPEQTPPGSARRAAGRVAPLAQENDGLSIPGRWNHDRGILLGRRGELQISRGFADTPRNQ